MLGVAPLEADDLAVDGDVLVELGDVDPLGIDDRAVGVGDGDDLAPLLVEEAGGVAADVAVALDGEGRVRRSSCSSRARISRAMIATP